MPPLGTRPLLFWKWSCSVAFSNALFAPFAQFKNLQRILSHSLWRAAKCNFVPWRTLFFFEWWREFIINVLECKVNSLFWEEQNSLWILPLGSCLSLCSCNVLTKKSAFNPGLRKDHLKASLAAVLQQSNYRAIFTRQIMLNGNGPWYFANHS